MTRRVWLFGLLLAVPLFSMAVAYGIDLRLNSQLRAAAHQRYPEAPPDVLAGLTLRRLCDQDPTSSACEPANQTRWMVRGSLFAIGLGLALLAAMWYAGRAARGDRLLLLRLFRPGLYITIGAVTVLIVLHAALAMAAIVMGESAFIGRVHGAFVLTIGLGAVLGLWTMFRGMASMVKAPQTFVLGESVSREQAPALWAKVDETARHMGALAPEHIVIGLDPSFFVTEARVACLTGPLAGRTLYCSLPLCRILSIDELVGIVGHELGHFKGQDTAFSAHFYPVYRGATTSLAALQSAGDGGLRQVALLPAMAVLAYFLECFSVAESEVSRERELAADREGAGATSAQTMATALVKVHAFAGVWQGFDTAAADALQQGRSFINASKAYADTVVANASPASFEGIAETHTAHPTDSHPPLAARLASLGVAMEAVATPALDVAPANGALSLVDGAVAREEALSEAYQYFLAKRLGIDLTPVADESAESPEA